MSTDFKGLRVIWPPDGTRPPKHDLDVVFVHGLQHGALSDWQDQDKVCWPAEHLSLDLGTARIFAFGYDLTTARVRSDGHYAGGVLFAPGEHLWSALKTRRTADKAQVPITFVGRGAGCIVIKSALCISRLKDEQLDPVLRKTRHVLFLEAPPGDLSWESWNQLSAHTSGAESRGQWKVWRAAQNSTIKLFNRISQYINVTSLGADRDYGAILSPIRQNRNCVINDSSEIQRIRAFLRRRPDLVNAARHEANIDRHCQGTGEWLFQDSKFSAWAAMKGAPPILWLVGPEGSGKSVLCSLAAERLRRIPAQQAVVHLMLAFDNPRSEYHLVTQLALQLLDYVLEHERGVDAETLLMLPEDENEDKKTFQVRALVEVLVSQCPAVFIFIDGLDEVGAKTKPEEQAHEDDKLESVQEQLYSVLSFVAGLTRNEDSAHVRLCCSSKHTSTIADRMRDIEAVELPLDKRSVADDLARYLEFRLQNARESNPSSSGRLNNTNVAQLSKATRNNFLLASIMFNDLVHANISGHDPLERSGLRAATNIDDLYEERLEILLASNNTASNTQSRALRVVRIIALVTYAKRPLRLFELQEALLMAMPLPRDSDDSGQVTFQEDLDPTGLQRDCAPFVSFDMDHSEANHGYVRIAHASAHNFLRNFARKRVTAAEETYISENLMAEVCLKILSQQKYNSTSLEFTSRSFYSYAAKYWHKHMDESDGDLSLLEAAGDFVRSRQFMTMTRFQSNFLLGHFGRRGHGKASASAFNIPKILSSKADMQDLVEDYRMLIREWGHVLDCGTETFEDCEILQQCFGGALVGHHGLRFCGSGNEKNESFLLYPKPCEEDVRDRRYLLSSSGFCDTINDDGSRVTVWRIPKHRQDKSEAASVVGINPTRESWLVDGRRPPFRYSAESIRVFDRLTSIASVRQDADSDFPLITNPDSDQHLTLVDEFIRGESVRIGDRVYRRTSGSTWTASSIASSKRATTWDSTVRRQPWTAYSHRKQIFQHQEEGEGYTLPVPNEPKKVPPSPPPPPPPPPAIEASRPSADDLESDKDELDHSIEGSSSTLESSSESDAVEPDDDSRLGDLLSSAEELLPESSSGHDLDSTTSDGDLSDSVGEDDVSSEEAGDQNAIDEDSDTTSQTSDESGSARKKSRVRIADEQSQKAFGDDSSDADDEEDLPAGEGKSKRKSEPKPKHHLSFSMYCDLCSRTIVPYGFRSNVMKQDVFYQCIPCARTTCYDICSTCFGKGAWCKDSSHSLSECVMYFDKQRFYWKDGISQQTATPLVKIVAGFDETDTTYKQERSFTPSFRYKHRHAGSLRGSKPTMHSTLPLLIYPLDGRQLLFGNLAENTFFTYDIPFGAQETAETSGNTCIPISVDLRFSSCGRYLYVLRMTARNDMLHAPLVLHMAVYTVALSSQDPISGKPQTLSCRQSIDLGVWPRMVVKLPHTVTWSDSYAYVSLSRKYLRVYRIPLRTQEWLDNDGDGFKSSVVVLSQRIALPYSARTRSVHFFPSKDTASAKIILASKNGNDPEPPAVVYLKDVETWTPLNERADDTASKSHHVDDSSTEEPYVDDDKHLMAEQTTGEGQPTLEPIMPIRDRLLRQWQKAGIYCPSCFELGIKIGFFRPHPNITFHHLNYIPTAETAAYKLEWRVGVPTLIEAMKAGCQFCCYVASRMLDFSHIRHTTQYIGDGGVSCCAKGAEIKISESIQNVIDHLRKMNWNHEVPEEKRIFTFHIEPQHWNLEARSFDKFLVTLPSVQVGGIFGEHKFAPIMITVTGKNDRGEASSLTTFIHQPEISGKGFPECVFELHAPLDDVAHHLIDTRPLATTRGEGDNLKVVEGWLEECQASHSFCGQHDNTNAELPTRLVEIVDAQTVKLVETAGQHGKYSALSYCWGPTSGENSMTKKANFRARMHPSGIRRDDLPAAIRDAITISERLGIQLIWVDTLCMIQDNIEDKHNELGRMSRYYLNSFLTIAASTPKSTIGFIGKTGRCEKHPNSSLPRDLVPLSALVHIHSSKDAGAAGKVYIREENPYQLHLEPINKRAWTLQECLLAPRVLLFGSRVMWFCQHMTHSDGGVEDWSFDQSDFERTRREFQIQLRKLERGGPDSTPSVTAGQDVYDLWHRIVGSYSRRALTWSADKLPAISAVAAEFSRLTDSDYLAGLWRANLARDLLWTTPHALTHGPQTWRAPSWSWASVDDAILYRNEPPKNATCLADIKEASTVSLTAVASFGEVESGSVVITAPSASVTLDESTRENFSKPWLREFQARMGATEREMLVESLKNAYEEQGKKKEQNEEEKFQMPDEVVVIFVYGKRDELYRSNDTATDVDDGEQRWMMWGLILKKAVGEMDGEQLYERVLSFSQVMVNCHESLFSDQKTFKVV